MSLFAGEAGPLLISGRSLDDCIVRGVVVRQPRKLALVRCTGSCLRLAELKNLFYQLPRLEVCPLSAECLCSLYVLSDCLNNLVREC